MQLLYFPYITLKDVDEINFPDLDAKVWNFDKKASDYITDDALRGHIDKILAMNVRGPHRIHDIGILSIGDTDFRQFNQDEYEIIHQVRIRLFLAFSAHNNTLSRSANTGLYIGTAENFSFVIQNFDPDSNHIAEQAGSIVSQTAGGYTMSELTFQAPGYILSPTQFRIDGYMLNGLAEIKQKRPKIYERILRASDLLFRAYFNDPYVDINSRILLMTAAFEVLLNLADDGRQRQNLKNAVMKYVDLPGEKIVSYWSERGRGRKVRERQTMKVKWADRLYVLRNHIIHGNSIKPIEYVFEGKQRHIDIAMLFFITLVQAKINASLRREVFFGHIKWSKYVDENGGGVEYEGFEFENGAIRRLIREARLRLR